MFDFHRALEAAIGYHELGMNGEALRELDALAPEHQNSQPTLELKAVLFQQMERWEDAARVQEQLSLFADASVECFIAWGCVLYELHRYADCRKALLSAPPSARSHGLWNYHLACYEVLLGNHSAGRELIRRAIELDPRLRSMALQNDNLRPHLNEAAGIPLK